MLAKIDIARAFRNLRVNPVDAFKFGISWQGSYYLDIWLDIWHLAGRMGVQLFK